MKIKEKKSISPQREKEERFQALFNHSFDCVYLLDFEGNIIDANPAMLNLLGFEKEELCSLNISSLLSPDQVQRAMQGIEEIRKSGSLKRLASYKARRKNGEYVYVETEGNIVYREGRPYAIQGIARDITERKRAEEKEKKYIHDLMTLSKMAFALVDLSPEDDIHLFLARHLKELVGHCLVSMSSFDEVTQQFSIRAILGISKHLNSILKLLGRHPMGMVAPINEIARAGLMSGKLEKVPGGLYELAVESISKPISQAIEKILNLGDIYAMGFAWKGKLFGSAGIYLPKGVELEDRSIIETFVRQASVALQRRQAEEALRKANEELEIRVRERTAELAKANEELQLEIIERMKATDELRKAYSDLKRAQEELVQSEKLAALGKFSSGITHEMKNPLGIILGGLEFLEHKLSSAESEVKIALKKVQEATHRADTIVQGVLRLSRPSEFKTERIEPEDFISETIALLRYKTPLEKIKIVTQFADEELSVEVDRDQMQQVLFNLLTNAIEAMPEKGEIVIKTYQMTQPDFPHDKKFCVIEVQDSGEGISEDNMKRLFEPFFTTKKEKRGIGLGLFMSKLIVTNHKGNLEIESKFGLGTKARIFLPLV